MMSLTTLFGIFLLLAFVSMLFIGYSLRKYSNNPPQTIAKELYITLALEIILFIAFVTNLLTKFPLVIVDIIWAVITFTGLIVGLKELRNSPLFSAIGTIASLALGLLWLLEKFVSSM